MGFEEKMWLSTIYARFGNLNLKRRVRLGKSVVMSGLCSVEFELMCGFKNLVISS